MIKAGRGKYTVHQVEERTNVLAATLRQWERRYGVPLPERAESGYRLYSDDDLKIIGDMQNHISGGIPASRAATLIKQTLSHNGEPQNLLSLRSRLVEALVNLDESRAENILSEAYGMYSIEVVVSEIFHGTMFDIGTSWHDGLIPITTEHFASNFVQGRLRLLMNIVGSTVSRLSVIVACAPQDMHEIGALSLAVLLQRQGYHIYFTGSNTPIADLVVMTETVDPIAVMISASSRESLLQLKQSKALLSNLSPFLIFGGGAFNKDPSEAEGLGGHFLAETASLAVHEFSHLINQRSPS